VIPSISAIVRIVGVVQGAGYSCAMARREVESLIAKLRQMSEEGASSFFREVMASDRLRKGLGRAGESFLSNKHNFDRNIESLLDFVNIPSKRDVRELKSRLDTLSTQLVNLSMKVDRMLAGRSGGEGPSPSRLSKSKLRPK
jgi:polyhydroxyalkanoate synthesis regulator phasin